jgi:hypothetical protein
VRVAVTTLAALAAATLALGAQADPSATPLLALRMGDDSDRLQLQEVDPLTLAPAGASLQLRDKSIAAWSRSPDGGRLALAPWDVPRVTIVERTGLRLAREVALPPGRYAQSLAWITPRRLLALVVACCSGGASIAVIDPERGDVVSRRAVPGVVRGVASFPAGLVLLLGRPGIGPARLAVGRADGRLRTAALPRTFVGARLVRGTAYTMVGRSAGLTVDPASKRAFVVGADEPVAEVDLRTLRVRYHVLARVRTLQAGMKVVRGPYRTAAWLGGALAVTGTNGRGTHFDPAGVHLIDTRTWRRRTLAPQAQFFVVGGEALAVLLPTELAVFGSDGRERFRVPGKFEWVQAAGGHAYALRRGGQMLVVDLSTGAVDTASVTLPPTVLGP